jgi:hypothetical protein
MAAGLGFKTFAVGEILSAANVNGYLMQGVLVFADATARDAAITSPQEGQFAYLKDTNVTTYYTGSAWANLDTTGMTNPMTTTGDMVYSSSGSTPARLGIGSTGNVLTVAGGVPTWAAPAGGGGMTLINSGGTTLSGSSTTISSIPSTYKNLQLIIRAYKPSSSGRAQIRFNGDSGAKYWKDFNASGATPSDTVFDISASQDSATDNGLITVNIFDYTTTTWKVASMVSLTNASSTTINTFTNTGVYIGTSAISSLTLYPTGTFTSGTAYLYGVS